MRRSPQRRASSWAKRDFRTEAGRCAGDRGRRGGWLLEYGCDYAWASRQPSFRDRAIVFSPPGMGRDHPYRRFPHARGDHSARPAHRRDRAGMGLGRGNGGSCGPRRDPAGRMHCPAAWPRQTHDFPGSQARPHPGRCHGRTRQQPGHAGLGRRRDRAKHPGLTTWRPVPGWEVRAIQKTQFSPVEAAAMKGLGGNGVPEIPAKARLTCRTARTAHAGAAGRPDDQSRLQHGRGHDPGPAPLMISVREGGVLVM